MVIVLMGVSGSGKTTVGQILAEELGWPFYDADDFHPAANVEKMRRGEALTDADRRPWLEALHAVIRRAVESGTHALVACSALRESYRQVLRQDLEPVRFVYLHGSCDVLRDRVERREHPFMSRTLLGSQLSTLEEPRDAVHADISLPPPAIARQIRQALGI
jgi:gluconokinase